MTSILFLLTTCKVIAMPFAAATTDIGVLPGTQRKVVCVGIEGSTQVFACTFTASDDKFEKSGTSTTAGVFRMLPTKEDIKGRLLVNSDLVDVLHWQGDKVVFHHRMLNDEVSGEIICSGTVAKAE